VGCAPPCTCHVTVHGQANAATPIQPSHLL
jgi:hypothetical protein